MGLSIPLGWITSRSLDFGPAQREPRKNADNNDTNESEDADAVGREQENDQISSEFRRTNRKQTRRHWEEDEDDVEPEERTTISTRTIDSFEEVSFFRQIVAKNNGEMGYGRKRAGNSRHALGGYRRVWGIRDCTSD